jgi:hypothetical protein
MTFFSVRFEMRRPAAFKTSTATGLCGEGGHLYYFGMIPMQNPLGAISTSIGYTVQASQFDFHSQSYAAVVTGSLKSTVVPSHPSQRLFQYKLCRRDVSSPGPEPAPNECPSTL